MNELSRSVSVLLLVVLGWTLIPQSSTLENNDFICESLKHGFTLWNKLEHPINLLMKKKYQSCGIYMSYKSTKQADDIIYSEECPIGFKKAITGNVTVCYKKKDPERFLDFYKDCSDNKFSLELYKQLDIDKSSPVWSEYKSAYPGGPFIDKSYTDHLHYELDPKYNVTYRDNQILEQDLCVLIEPAQSYMTMDCEEKYHRYCIIEPLLDQDNENMEIECRDLHYTLTFSSPVLTCLKMKETGHVNMTWIEAHKLCNKDGLSLLNRGWRYANHPELKHSVFPLAAFISSDYSVNDASSDFGAHALDQNFKYGAAWIDNKWEFIDSSYNFTQVICEPTFKPRKRTLKLEVDKIERNSTMVFESSEKMESKDVYCFKHVDWRFPNVIKFESSSNKNIMLLRHYDVGQYMCIYKDPFATTIKKSNLLSINTLGNQFLSQNFYSVKFRSNVEYRNDNFDEQHNELVQDLIKCFRHVNSSIGLDFEAYKNWTKQSNYILYETNITGLNYLIPKRKYRDGKTFLYHLWLSPEFKPAVPGRCNNVEVLFMRRLDHCDEVQTEYGDILPQGNHGTTQNMTCATYKCGCKTVEGCEWVKNSSSGNVSDDTCSDMKEVTNELQRLVNDSVPMENISGVFKKVDNILGFKKGLEFSGGLLFWLDQLGTTLKLNGSRKVGKAVGTNVALLVGDADANSPIWGFKMGVQNNSWSTNDSIDIITRTPESDILYASINDAVVLLPASVAVSKLRISFVVFRDDRAFQISTNGSKNVEINSRVISVTIKKITQFKKGEVIDINFSPLRANMRNESRSCAYWHFTGENNNTGYWSQEGCTFIGAARPGLLDTCRCNHLTHFAALLVPKAVFSEKNETVLEIISIIGCCLSILGLTMVAVTAATFRSWRQQFNNKIWLQLCISICLISICFVIIVIEKFSEYNTACMLVGIALHYSVLCSFCWMLVAAVLSYRRLVIVYTTEVSHRLFKASAFSYGTPCVVVGILLMVAPHSYAKHFEEKFALGIFCYPSGLSLWITVYAPVVTILFVNWTLFILIVYYVYVSKKIKRYGGDSNEVLRCVSVSCLLVFLFGLPWITGLFANNIVAAYLFSITTSFQGFILFLFLVAAKEQTRNMWMKKINIKFTRNDSKTNSYE